MSKPDYLLRRSVEDKFRTDADFCDEGQLLDLMNNRVGKEEDAEDVELEGIVIATWEKKNGLQVVP